jgi:hypothetical protein
MDPFVRRLVEHLLNPARPVSRNRHFQTFENPLGRRALRIAKRITGLRHDILECLRVGGTSRLKVERPERGQVRLELSLDWLGARRVTALDAAELALLLNLPGMDVALRER